MCHRKQHHSVASGRFPCSGTDSKGTTAFPYKKEKFLFKVSGVCTDSEVSKKFLALNYFLEKKNIFFSFLFFLNLLLNVCLLNISVSSSFLAGFWHDGVDSGRGHRVFPRVCSLLAHVFLCPVLGPDHLPLYSLPHWGSQQDLTGPLD